MPPQAPQPAQAPITDADPSVEQMARQVARFGALMPTADYIDAAIPGCERTTWRVIGEPGAAPLPAEHFHMNIVRCEPGQSAPLHNQLTQEVFLVLSGSWEVFWGPLGARCLRLRAAPGAAVRRSEGPGNDLGYSASRHTQKTAGAPARP